VIVSHLIVLFDFIEERHEQGENLRDALIDAGILRIRPVLITVAAAMLALFPLAVQRRSPVGGALLCADRPAIATSGTLAMVPVICLILVLDLSVINGRLPLAILPAWSQLPKRTNRNVLILTR
jgi:multidrug efflux pump subunit AcrB